MVLTQRPSSTGHPAIPDTPHTSTAWHSMAQQQQRLPPQQVNLAKPVSHRPAHDPASHHVAAQHPARPLGLKVFTARTVARSSPCKVHIYAREYNRTEIQENSLFSLVYLAGRHQG